MQEFFDNINSLKSKNWNDFYSQSIKRARQEISDSSSNEAFIRLEKLIGYNFDIISNSCTDIFCRLGTKSSILGKQIIEITESLEFQLEIFESYKRGHYAVSYSLLRVINEIIIHSFWTGFSFNDDVKFNYTNFIKDNFGVDIKDAFGYHELSQYAHFSSIYVSARQLALVDENKIGSMDLVRINMHIKGNEEIPQYFIFYQWCILNFLKMIEEKIGMKDSDLNTEPILYESIEYIEKSVFSNFSDSVIPFQKYCLIYKKILITLAIRS